MGSKNVIKIIKKKIIFLIIHLKKPIKFLKELRLFNTKNAIYINYFQDIKNPNFGDELNIYILKKLTNKKIVKCNEFSLRKHFLIIGSILHYANSKSIIFGSGIIRKNEIIEKPYKIYSVRGPITRKKFIELGYECPENYGDPALILPLILKIDERKIYRIGIIPHYTQYNEVKKKYKDNKQIIVIDLTKNVEKIVQNINRCYAIISSSLHGIIVSQTYKIPVLYVKLSNKKLYGDDIKFKDYFESVKIPFYKPYNFSIKKINISEIETLIEKHNFSLNIDIKKIKNKLENIINNL